MGASSVTGVSGPGDAGKATTNALSIAALGPQVVLTGRAESAEIGPFSPPTPNGSVVLPRPLLGLAEDYVVILTTFAGGWAYITDMDDDDLDGDGVDDHFVGFSFITESECDVMYAVFSVGVKPMPTL